MSLPGRALGPAVERLRECLPEEGAALLADLHAAVVQQLKGQGGEGAAGGEGGGEALAALVAASRQRLVAAESRGAAAGAHGDAGGEGSAR